MYLMKYIAPSIILMSLCACSQTTEKSLELTEPVLGARVSPKIAYPENPPTPLCDQIKIECEQSFLAGSTVSSGIEYLLVVRIHGVFLDDGNDVADGWTADNGLVVQKLGNSYSLISNDIAALDSEEPNLSKATAVQLYLAALRNLERNVSRSLILESIKRAPSCSENLREALSLAKLPRCGSNRAK
jgi:hypothetical protein